MTTTEDNEDQGAVEAIAHALDEGRFSRYGHDGMVVVQPAIVAQRILSALAEAGYTVVKTGETHWEYGQVSGCRADARAHITFTSKGERIDALCSKCQMGIEIGATFGPIPGEVLLAQWIKQHTHKPRKSRASA